MTNYKSKYSLLEKPIEKCISTNINNSVSRRFGISCHSDSTHVDAKTFWYLNYILPSLHLYQLSESMWSQIVDYLSVTLYRKRQLIAKTCSYIHVAVIVKELYTMVLEVL